jgi:hypothetical protein
MVLYSTTIAIVIDFLIGLVTMLGAWCLVVGAPITTSVGLHLFMLQ